MEQRKQTRKEKQTTFTRSSSLTTTLTTKLEKRNIWKIVGKKIKNKGIKNKSPKCQIH
jgi:hypothetical protein